MKLTKIQDDRSGYRFHWLIFFATFSVLCGMFSISALGQSAPNPDSQKLGPNHPAIRSQLLKLERQVEGWQRKRDVFSDRTLALAAERDVLAKDLLNLDVTEHSYHEVLQWLQTQRVQLIVDLAGLDARLTARREALEENRLQMLNPVSEHRIDFLTQMVDQSRSKLDQTQELARLERLSNAEVAESRLKLLEAEMNLAEAKSAMEKNGSDNELVETAIEQAEKRARLASIEKLLKTYYDARSKIESSQRLDVIHQRELQRLYEIEDHLQQSETERDALETDAN